MLSQSVKSWLLLPEASQMRDLDDPGNIHLLRRIIQRKPFLFKTYQSFYRELLAKVSDCPLDGKLVELGSGASFLKSYAPHLVTSDVLPYSTVDLVFSALNMPFEDESVTAFVMVDVLHHLKDSRQFFREAERCLLPGGKIVMIEPANTTWSSLIYKNFHHEPFNPRGGWGFDEGGPLSGANMAIPWIIFQRDRQQFMQEFPNLKICSLREHTPFRYLLSGGLSVRQLLPSWTYPVVRAIERLLFPLNRYFGMFVTIELKKTRHDLIAY